MSYVLGIIFLLILLGFLMGFVIYASFLLYSSFKGSPYVPTKRKFILKILENAKLKKATRMLELGCGDGRVLIEAVKSHGIVGYGIDINPVVINQAKWNARKLSADRIKFEVKNLDKVEVGDYDVVYLFLLPKILAEVAPKWQREAKKGSLFISHGFEIKSWGKMLEERLEGEPYDTYFYRMTG